VLFREVTDIFLFSKFLSPLLKYCGHKPFSYSEFRVNRRSKNRALRRDVNEFMFGLGEVLYKKSERNAA
jgi:hypothetical protein